jgi:hypothetical protein
MKSTKEKYKKDIKDFNYYGILIAIDKFENSSSFENNIYDDLNEIFDLTYSIKKMNEFSFIEI